MLIIIAREKPWHRDKTVLQVHYQTRRGKHQEGQGMIKNSIFAPKFPEYKSGIQEKPLKCFHVPSNFCTYYNYSDRWQSGIWTDNNSSSASYFSSTFFPPPLFLIACLQLSFPLILGNNHLPRESVEFIHMDQQITKLTLNFFNWLQKHQVIILTMSFQLGWCSSNLQGNRQVFFTARAGRALHSGNMQ